MEKAKILWVDDEIEMLKPHVIFLEDKDYNLDTVSNGSDAIHMVEENNYDLVLLDEMMPGLDGLETLTKIKEIDKTIPVIMVTKNEEEGLMNKAISKQITDYIIKPINPHQVLMAIKKILMSEKIRRDRIGEEYTRFSSWLNREIFSAPDLKKWYEIYSKFVRWDLRLDKLGYEDLLNIHTYERKNTNEEFSEYITENYKNFIREHQPTMSHDIVEKYLMPQLEKKKPVYFIVLDCLRLDQLHVIEPYLQELFNIKTQHYLSILPTSTPYSRNAIFAGMLPKDIAEKTPQYWKSNSEVEDSRNRYEHFLIDRLLKKHGFRFPNGTKYTKILDQEEGKFVVKQIPKYENEQLIILVYNFLDMLLHHRFKDEILKEMLPNDKALRSLTDVWFQNSDLYKAIKKIAAQGATVVLTTDHGSIKVGHPMKVRTDKEASYGLRSKHGKNISCKSSHAYKVKNPQEIGVPSANIVDNFIFAKGDYYFVYPTSYNEYKKKFHGTYQHGGISMEEMILPISILTPKK
ncbi:MAG: response regulator [Candidatus Cloacimonetes bacterium]|nr:response regulator [Candidatus Cloacimonadota bacterium]MBS3766862.1 response regulator [Candidatus Cloacimonadota bacterium]